METAEDFLRFFREHLLRAGVRRLAACGAASPAEAEEMIRAFAGVCLDTCHLAVAGENAAAALAAVCREGARVVKLQLGAALRAPNTGPGRAALARFGEPVYLHQVTGWAGLRRVAAWEDLPGALAGAAEGSGVDELRVHVHVPLFWAGDALLRPTAQDLGADFWRAVRGGAVPHVEVETYTFHVLPEALRPAGVEQSVAAELRWVLDPSRLGPAPG